MMSRFILLIAFGWGFQSAVAQPLLKAGDLFPDVLIRPLVNAPIKSMEVRGRTGKEEILILNFWGTWCSPCLPEMDSLAVLQQRNPGIRVVAISDEPVERLQKYLSRKPSGLWLASDTAGTLYQQLALRYVGQAVILNRAGRILAMVRTDSIDQKMIGKLLRGETVRSSAETGREMDIESDPFAVDSSLNAQLSWSSYRKNMHSMSKRYVGSAFEGRRVSYFNVCPDNIYRDIYKVSLKQVEYEGDAKDYCRWSSKKGLICVDLLVEPAQKDSLMILLGQAMDKFCPLKARTGRKTMTVYLLQRLPGGAAWKDSDSLKGSYGFSGKGFEGTGIGMDIFADYLGNELEAPIVDETGLKGHYDIRTENALRSKEDIMTALNKLGLTVIKAEREMPIVVIYKKS